MQYTNTDQVLRWFVDNSPTIKAEADRWDKVTCRGVTMNSTEEVGGEVAKELYQTVDGMGLSSHARVPHLHLGRRYIGAVQVRCNTLYTRAIWKGDQL